ncbi:MAG: dockerin type I domain-containing protein [Oscillospiraceae bacterium]|nr:dockerin type I domain-containing protein [Oscillospiraceae bacterium]MDD6084792.1 dockerin type I domain-containing protein [Oscillospiraceae bacterium]MDY3256905.1 dockerin type I domain-containing protein [Ruminococcus callidus]
MKKIKNVVSGLICVGMLSSVGSLTANAKTVNPNEDMQLIQGSIGVTVEGTGGAEIIIEKETFEGKLKYYDIKAENGTYTFLLDACEYDFSGRDYTSSYSITFKSLADSKSSVTVSNVIIADNGYESSKTYSHYDYNVTLNKSSTRSVNHDIVPPKMVEDRYEGSGTIEINYKSFTVGDVNRDEKIDSKDAVRILQDYASYLTSNKYSLDMDTADVNGDGKTDSKDAVRVLIYYAATLVNSNVPPIEEYFN